jgi:alkylation response protein AidB-like acyl-CoA dehydrogenase
MNFGFSQEQQAFQQEVRAWIQENLPDGWRELDPDYLSDTEEIIHMAVEFEKKMAAKGWHAPHYPKKYGGMDATPEEQFIIRQEKYHCGAPSSHNDMMGVDFVGPTILVHGTEEQKEKYVGGLGRGELIFSIGYSEPNCGSDLASLQTRAVKDGDDYSINGVKTFQTNARHSDYCWLAARTDPEAPKHKGITVFIVDMKSEGIETTPMNNVLGYAHFDETAFNDVRVPATEIVGGLNMGWPVLMTALSYERSIIHPVYYTRRLLEDLVSFAKETPWRDGALSDNPAVRRKLAELAVENEGAALLGYRLMSLQMKGEIPSYQPAVSYVMVSQHARHMASAGLDILGRYGQLTGASKWTPLKGRLSAFFLSSIPLGIGGGTFEIQRGIIAKLGLGMG